MHHTLKITITAVGEPDSIFLTPCEPVTVHESEIETDDYPESFATPNFTGLPAAAADHAEDGDPLGPAAALEALAEPGFYILEDGPHGI